MNTVRTPGSTQSQSSWIDAGSLADALRSAAPKLLFGVRLWIAVCLSLGIAFWLELDDPAWAGTSAAIVCQPSLGASLRKGWFRMIGTVVGAMATVVLTACFPQSRIGFFVGLALWGAACGFVATQLRNFASYSASLAGYTAAIIASDELGAVGGVNGHTAFMLAVSRAGEICIGIMCASIVLAGTDYGRARRRLAGQLETISAEITGRLVGTFLLAQEDQTQTRQLRRDLVRRVTALDPVIDEVVGEFMELRHRMSLLKAAEGGLFSALASWRVAAVHREVRLDDRGQGEAELIYRSLPQELRLAPAQSAATRWTVDPVRARRACSVAVRALAALPGNTPSQRLLADRAALALIGIRRALDGLLLLTHPARAIRGARFGWLHIADWLPSFVNAVRIFVTIGAVELFWIKTEWPDGATALEFASIGVILFSPVADQAYRTAARYAAGIAIGAVFAGIIKFAVLPGVTTFAGFGLAIGLVLVPAAALMAQAWRPTTFAAIAGWFIAILGPANQIAYDSVQFYNTAAATVAGFGIAALSFRLLPPLSPELRSHRLLALTLRDLHRLAREPVPRDMKSWESRVYSRLSALPAQSTPSQRSELLAALSIGEEIIRLRTIARRFDLHAELGAALDALSEGNSIVAIGWLAQLDEKLAELPDTQPGSRIRLRARASILAMTETLTQHTEYFELETVQMRFTEINLLGAYVAPISLMMAAAWLIVIALRRIAAHFGLLQYVWHPALVVLATYMIVLSSIVLIVAD